MAKRWYENQFEALAPRREYLRRMVGSSITAGTLIAASWIVGAVCYHYVAGIPKWTDSFYNAAMILGGEGPVDVLKTDQGKIFASLYALYSGVILLTSVGIFVTPSVHRFLHRFHMEATEP